MNEKALERVKALEREVAELKAELEGTKEWSRHRVGEIYRFGAGRYQIDLTFDEREHAEYARELLVNSWRYDKWGDFPIQRAQWHMGEVRKA